MTLFEPHNDYLYEAHIPQALLAYNATLKQFQRSTLLDSTAMVMTPVDILQPHLQVDTGLVLADSFTGRHWSGAC